MNTEQISEKSNNQASLTGTIKSIELGHELYGEQFFYMTIKAQRLSGTYDEIPVTVSERLMIDNDYGVGDIVSVTGQFRSYNAVENGKNRLRLSVFAKAISHYTDEDKNVNEVSFKGFICKPPVKRSTPLGREIADVLIAVNRNYNKSDYIPLVIWGRHARYAATLKVGDKIEVSGRMQSREYQKQSEDGLLTKTAYEVSVNRISLVDKGRAKMNSHDEKKLEAYDEQYVEIL